MLLYNFKSLRRGNGALLRVEVEGIYFQIIRIKQVGVDLRVMKVANLFLLIYLLIVLQQRWAINYSRAFLFGVLAVCFSCERIGLGWKCNPHISGLLARRGAVVASGPDRQLRRRELISQVFTSLCHYWVIGCEAKKQKEKAKKAGCGRGSALKIAPVVSGVLYVRVHWWRSPALHVTAGQFTPPWPCL